MEMENIETQKAFSRIQSVDFLRGLIMIIMAIDHVRVYAGVPAGGITPDVFFTRWVTHFCAPGFVFLAGTSAFLYYKKKQDKQDLFRFLVTRGIVLVLLELTVIRFLWTFNFDWADFTMTGVVWALGWCMILLAFFVNLSTKAMILVGLAIVFGQQVFHYFPVGIFPSSAQHFVSSVWGFFYPSKIAAQSAQNISPGLPALPSTFGISIFYVIIPWVGVMMLGYAFGNIYNSTADYLKKNALRIGIAATLLFLVASPFLINGNAGAASQMPFLLQILNQQKYPPTQLYILMTLGPMIALVPWAERASGKLFDAVRIIGKVPMFYYLLHILLIHLSAFVVNLILFGNINQELYSRAPFVAIAIDQRWSLPVLYTVWLIDVIILYVACKWYAGYKSSHPEIKWLKFL